MIDEADKCDVYGSMLLCFHVFQPPTKPLSDSADQHMRDTSELSVSAGLLTFRLRDISYTKPSPGTVKKTMFQIFMFNVCFSLVDV